MYIVNNAITFTWAIRKTGSPLLEADYDIHLVESPLGVTYTDGSLTSYVAPTASTDGQAVFTFTPDAAGLWRVKLTTGTDESYTVVGNRMAWVFAAAAAAPRSPHCHHVPMNVYLVKPTIPV